MLDRKYYTPEELATRFNLSLSTIYNLLNQGTLPSIRLGRCYRIPQEELARSLSGKPKGRPAPEAAQRFVTMVTDASPRLRNNVIAIILFGSYARGDYNKRSDIDLLVILKKQDQTINDAISELSTEAMAATDYDDFLSVIPMSEAQWERARKLRTPFCNVVSREGITLWKKP